MLERIQSQIDENTRADSEKKYASKSFANINPTYGAIGASHGVFFAEQRKCPNLQKLLERKKTDINIDKNSIDSERVRSITKGELNDRSGNVFRVGPMLRSMKL